jgi:hypothetical protein
MAERARHGLENTFLRQACCERHCHTSAHPATSCVSPRGFPDAWHTFPKHAGSDTEVLHRAAEYRLRGGSRPCGQSPCNEGDSHPRGQILMDFQSIAPTIRSQCYCYQNTITQSKQHRHPPPPRQLTTVVGEARLPSEASCLLAFP